MKNILKYVGIIALAAVIGFAMTGCENSTSSSNNNSGPTFVEVSGDILGPWTGSLNGQTGTITVIASSWKASIPYYSYADTGKFLSWKGNTAELYSNNNGKNVGTVTITDSTHATLVLNGNSVAPGTHTLTRGGSGTGWSYVTTISQVNGSWKAPSTPVTANIQGISAVVSYTNYIITFNAAAKTMSVSGSATTTFTGENIDAMWSDIKTRIQLSMIQGGTFSFNDVNHSVTFIYNNNSVAITDMDLASLGIQIYQDGSKFKWDAGGIEVTYTKQ